MGKIFSFASWNVEHFKGKYDRVQACVKFIKDSNPDVFAIFEVEGKYVFSDVVQLMDTHNFFITEDLGKMEILVGVNRNFVAFITQRHEFKGQMPTLRPGALATLTINNQYYSILFLHLKSADDPRSWGLRDNMISHVKGLKSALDKAPGVSDNGANFICIGDLNTMGMNLTYSDKDLSTIDELARYKRILSRKNLKLLSKDQEHTWWNGVGSSYDPSDLDHVFASKHLKFRKFAGAEISVRGWPEKSSQEAQTKWINSYSDHAMIYGEVIE